MILGKRKTVPNTAQVLVGTVFAIAGMSWVVDFINVCYKLNFFQQFGRQI